MITPVYRPAAPRVRAADSGRRLAAEPSPGEVQAEAFLRRFIAQDGRPISGAMEPQFPDGTPEHVRRFIEAVGAAHVVIPFTFEEHDEAYTDELACRALTNHGSLDPFTDFIGAQKDGRFAKPTTIFSEQTVENDEKCYLNILQEFGVEDPRGSTGNQAEATVNDVERVRAMWKEGVKLT
jgi:hypothetical protein